MITEKDLEELQVTAEAHERYGETDSYQAVLRTKYQIYHSYYAPPNGDQWPEDRTKRPGKIHLSANFIKAAVDVDTRLQSILPRLSLYPNGIDEQSRLAAEVAEKAMIRYLEMTDWEVWLPDLVKPKCLYGKGVLKYFWNNEDKRPDVVVVENPANLRLGWGSSDFRVLDWAIYEYSISPIEAMRQYPEIIIHPSAGKRPLTVQRQGDHSDPLAQLPVGMQNDPRNRPFYQPSQYEQKQIGVWDYWYRDEESVVRNAIFVGGVLAKDIAKHPEMIDIPYIVIENDHEPGSPEGISDVEPLIDIQYELNRALSHWSQLVADEIDPAWQMTGDNADAVPPGLVPKGGQIVAPGSGNEIKPIAKPINQFPIQALIQEYWQEFHKISGLSEILFGQNPAAQTTGRALAVQVEAAVNRLDVKRRRLYRGLKQLLVAWAFMLEKMDPKITVPQRNEQGEIVIVEIGMGQVVKGFRRWKAVAPEITPKDSVDNTQNVINKINARTLSVRTGMDEMGVDSPEDEIALIREERSDPKMFPGDVQAQVAVETQLVQLSQMMQQLQATVQQYMAQSAAPPPTGQGQIQQQQYEAAPTVGVDQNEAPGQPASFPGGPPAPGGAAPQATPTTLVRAQQNGQALTLNQLAFGGGR